MQTQNYKNSSIPKIDLSGDIAAAQIEQNRVRIAKQQITQQQILQSMMSSTSALSGRQFAYTNEVPFESDILNTNRYRMVDVCQLAETVLGFGISNSTLVRGLPCTPISVPGLAVTVGVGAVYTFEFYDATSYGVVPADTNPNHMLYKQGINFDPVNLTTPVPVTPGNSVIHLVQVQFVTQDNNVISRPYYNSADPADPIFQSQPDVRQDLVNIALKPGVEGVSPTPPTPDAGYTGLYYVTVAYGQSVIISGNIAPLSGAPFITEGLTQKVSSATIAAGYVSITNQRNSTYVSGIDIGAPNALVINPTTPYISYGFGTIISVKVANKNTGASTANVNSLGVRNIKVLTPLGLMNTAGGEMLSGGVYDLFDDGANFQLKNPSVNRALHANVSFTPTGQQTVVAANGTPRIVQFNNVLEDDYSWWDAVNFRFVPGLLGTYSISGIVHANFPISTNSQVIAVYKNGFLDQWLQEIPISTSTEDLTLQGNDIFHVTDVNDYFDLRYIDRSASGSVVIGAVNGSPATLGDKTNSFTIEYAGN